jgi:uncharacterized protein YjbI with pentapeptide repeats
MANQEHLDLLKQGTRTWNEWREDHPDILVDFSRANLDRINLDKANLSQANLREATLIKVSLSHANLSQADLSRANLDGANLQWANLSEANFSGAILTGCSIYAVSAWNVYLVDAIQSDLIITREDEPTITIDNLIVAQLIYSLLNNQQIRGIIDTITTKVVLLLGRFTPERKAVLDALREELRQHGYIPVLFDFERPTSRDITETLSTLAHLSRFIIVDMTDAKNIPHELASIVPTLIIPVQPLLHVSGQEYAMFEQFNKYPWVLSTVRYTNTSDLLGSLTEYVIKPAEEKALELEKIKQR